MGPSLEALREFCDDKFSEQTVSLIALQLLARIETVHAKGYIHRDIKPENFLIGSKGSRKEDVIFIIDFGLAKRYIDPKTGHHIKFKKDKGPLGTVRYTSLNATLGGE